MTFSPESWSAFNAIALEHVEIRIDYSLPECSEPWLYHFSTDERDYVVWNGSLKLEGRRRILESIMAGDTFEERREIVKSILAADPPENDSKSDSPYKTAEQLYDDLPRIPKMLGIEWVSDHPMSGDAVGIIAVRQRAARSSLLACTSPNHLMKMVATENWLFSPGQSPWI